MAGPPRADNGAGHDDDQEPNYLSIEELNARARIVVDPDQNINMYIRSAQNLFREGNVYQGEGELQPAYERFMRFSILVLEELPKHPDFNNHSNQVVLSILKKNCQEALNKLEMLKPVLEKRYRMQQTRLRQAGSTSSDPSSSSSSSSTTTAEQLLAAAPSVPSARMRSVSETPSPRVDKTPPVALRKDSSTASPRRVSVQQDGRAPPPLLPKPQITPAVIHALQSPAHGHGVDGHARPATPPSPPSLTRRPLPGGYSRTNSLSRPGSPMFLGSTGSTPPVPTAPKPKIGGAGSSSSGQHGAGVTTLPSGASDGVGGPSFLEARSQWMKQQKAGTPDFTSDSPSLGDLSDGRAPVTTSAALPSSFALELEKITGSSASSASDPFGLDPSGPSWNHVPLQRAPPAIMARNANSGMMAAVMVPKPAPAPTPPPVPSARPTASPRPGSFATTGETKKPSTEPLDPFALFPKLPEAPPPFSMSDAGASTAPPSEPAGPAKIREGPPTDRGPYAFPPQLDENPTSSSSMTLQRVNKVVRDGIEMEIPLWTPNELTEELLRLTPGIAGATPSGEPVASSGQTTISLDDQIMRFESMFPEVAADSGSVATADLAAAAALVAATAPNVSRSVGYPALDMAPPSSMLPHNKWSPPPVPSASAPPAIPPRPVVFSPAPVAAVMDAPLRVASAMGHARHPSASAPVMNPARMQAPPPLPTKPVGLQNSLQSRPLPTTPPALAPKPVHVAVVRPDPVSDPTPTPPPAAAAAPARVKKPEVKTVLGRLENNRELRTMFIPRDLIDKFEVVARRNTEANLETCGILCGTMFRGQLYTTHLLIPKQVATSDTCATTHEEELVAYQDAHHLITLGWIHTHPTQTCFMSSVDLHTHCSYQVMLDEAVAIVLSPRHNNPRYGVFRLTHPPGLEFLLKCPEKNTFHPHPDHIPLYTNADARIAPGAGHVVLVDSTQGRIKVVDLRGQ
ncbi:hypothetical protein GGF31_007836 [Allomyces arbusculus]|nr:hypothetical protein GGF31_007836 [Allomyces arbusculus]